MTYVLEGVVEYHALARLPLPRLVADADAAARRDLEAQVDA